MRPILIANSPTGNRILNQSRRQSRNGGSEQNGNHKTYRTVYYRWRNNLCAASAHNGPLLRDSPLPAPPKGGFPFEALQASRAPRSYPYTAQPLRAPPRPLKRPQNSTLNPRTHANMAKSSATSSESSAASHSLRPQRGSDSGRKLRRNRFIRIARGKACNALIVIA